MAVANNEGKVCDAVVRVLEKWTGSARTDVRHPEKDGVGPPVDLRLKLGAREYAIEHTANRVLPESDRDVCGREPDRPPHPKVHPGPFAERVLLRTAIPDRRFLAQEQGQARTCAVQSC